jgi:hypothetical protein
MAKINKTGRSKGRDRYVEIPHYLVKCHAWRCLTVHSRAAWLELMTEYYGANNGKIVMSARMMGDRLNCSYATAARAINELITYGFVEIGTASAFPKKRLAREYRMTHIKCDLTGELATKAFMLLTAQTKLTKPQVVQPKLQPNGKANASHSSMGDTHSSISEQP